jgi:HD-GYP domain-containing protein (c-di-GMP phosphodiesterase class II)
MGERCPVADAVLYQHERWDGQGFPQGLKGEEIPLMSRVIAILSAFDAVAGQASAGEGTAASALQALKLSAGTRFDPDLTALFVSMMTENVVASPEAEKEVCLR